MPIVDIILFAALAVFFAIRLFRVLGQRTGNESPSESREDDVFGVDLPQESTVQEIPAEIVPATTKISSTVAAQAAVIQQFDPEFTLEEFTKNVVKAFCLILKAFSEHDREMLAKLLDVSVFKVFNQAILAHEHAGHKLEHEVVGVKVLEILSLTLNDMIAEMKIRFVSEQIHYVRDSQGTIIEGVPNMVDEIEDVWSFQRDLGDPNPIWKLIKT